MAGKGRNKMDVRIYLRGDDVIAAPAAYLGDRWAAFKAACDAAGFRSRKVDGAWEQWAAGDKLPALIDALKAAGFTVIGTKETHAVMARALLGAPTSKAGMAAAVRAAKVDGLYPFQVDGAAWLAGRSAALLGDEMGLGKTVQVLVSLPDKAQAVVVGPACTKDVWAAECKKWRPDLTPVVLSGKDSFRWPEPGEVVILNYDILPAGDTYSPEGKSYKLPVPTPGCPKGVVLVGDEAHMVKSSRTQRTAGMKSLAEAVRQAAGKIWLLSGTPLLNQPVELWNVLGVAGLAREAYGSWDGFVGAFGGSKGRWGGYVWPVNPPAEAASRLGRVMLRRLRATVLPQLPGKTWQNVPVNGLDAATIKACDAALKALEDAGYTADAVADVTKAKGQIPFAKLSNARMLLAAAKIPALLELLETYKEANEPVLVFSAHVAPVKAAGSRPGWAMITGDTSGAERTAIVERFQAGLLKGVAITIAAGGVGLTLTRAAHEVFVDLEWTPAKNAQAEDRAVRIGQTRGVVIKRLVAKHPLDQRVLEILGGKAALIGATVQATA